MIKLRFLVGLAILFFSVIFYCQKVKAETTIFPLTNSPLILSEVLPDPEGDDELGEFIEIQNISTENVNLTGWRIEFKGGANSKVFAMPASELKAGEWQAFYYQDTKIKFINSGGEIFLYAPSGDLVDYFNYPKAKENQAWGRTCAGESWLAPSPGIKNHTPVSLDKISISPDAINFVKNTTIDFLISVNALCDEVKFVKASLPSPISREFFLTGEASEFTGSFEYQKFQIDKAQIFEFDIFVFGENNLIFTQKFPVKFYDDASAVILSEVYPNPPVGQDEFIELFNQSSRPIDLTYYFLDDGEGGSQPFEFNQTILPWDYFSVSKEQTKIVLNNDGDWARLLSPELRIVDSVKFKKTKKGWSYAKFGQSWRWSEIITPYKKNQEMIYPAGIYISEILPNPKGADSELEFIELFNSMDIPVDLSGWVLSDGTKKFLLENIAIASKSYIAIYSRDSKISLKNSADWVLLANPRGDIISKIHYSFIGQEDQSFALIGQNFAWTLSPTPNARNILLGKIEVPVVKNNIEAIAISAPTAEPAPSEISDIKNTVTLTQTIITTTTRVAVAKPSAWQFLQKNLEKLLTSETVLPSVKAQIQSPAVLGLESQRLTNPLIFVIIKYASLGLLSLSIIKLWRLIIQKMRLIQKE